MPAEPLGLAPKTRVVVTIDGAPEQEPSDWLEIAASVKLQGPPNASERVHEVLYGIEGR